MIADKLQNCELYYGSHKNFKAAFDFLKKAVSENLAPGKYELDGKDLYANIMEYDTKLVSKAEAHKNYIDIQFIVSGVEVMDFCDISKATPNTEYNAEKDVMFYTDCPKSGTCVIEAGEYAIFFPHDVHKPGMCFGNPAAVKKIVVKVKV